MNLINKSFKTVDVIEKGEELLYKAYEPKAVAQKKTLIIGMDGGSTQTRTLIGDKDDLDFEELYVVPSRYKFTKSDEEIRPLTDKLYDNLDSFIISTNRESKSLFDKIRVLRGSKSQGSSFPEGVLSSSAFKINTPAFYVNIIDSIAYSMVQFYKHEIPSEVDIYLGISLPPRETKFKKDRDAFLERILGTFRWENNDLGIVTNINIKNVCSTSEPEAFVKSYNSLLDREVAEVTMCINGGGRSTGVEMLENGKTSPNGVVDFNYGGKQLRDKLFSLMANELPVTKNDSFLAQALITGKYKYGNGYLPVEAFIDKAKFEFAETVKNDIVSNIFDLGVEPTSINEIVLCGRLFDKGDYGVSIVDHLKPMLLELSPETTFIHVTENYIPYGNVGAVVCDFYNELLEIGVLPNDEEEQAEKEVASTVSEF